MNRFCVALALASLWLGPALAQSTPGLSYGYVPTAGQLNSYFGAKQDVLGYTPVNRAGDTLTGELFTTAPTTTRSGFNLLPGVAPSSPQNGDMWTTSAGLYVRINGATIGPLSGSTSILGTANTWTATQTFPNNSLTLAEFPTIAANTVIGNFGASTATPSAQTINGGSTCSTALTYTNGTGFGCNAALGIVPRSYIGGLLLSNDATTPNTIIDIGAGQATSSDQTTVMPLASPITKTTGGTWAVGSGNAGLDNGSVAASTWYHVYEVERTDTGVVDVLLSQAPGTSSPVTITIASPGVITWTNHGLAAGSPVVFSTTGALPTGITAGTQYWVIAAGLGTSTFEISATKGGSAINTSGSQSGTQTGTSSPIMPTSYTKWRRLGSILTNGSSQITAFKQLGDAFLWVAPPQDVSTTTLSTTGVLSVLTLPPGVNLQAVIYGQMASATPGTGVLVFSPDAVGTTGSIAIAQVANLAVAYGRNNIKTNTAAQVKYSASAPSTTFYLITDGWIDDRGKSN